MFAASTREALLAGARHACAALIERAAQQATEQLGAPVHVVLCGGAAASIESLLQIACQREDDLVLRGLAALARAGQPIA
jgi:pantothenate kinase type III